MMSMKIELVERAAKGESVAALCRELGVSRATGHKWIKRFKELGYDGLEEKSKKPLKTPLGTAEDVVMAVLELRDSHPRWGAVKIQAVLRRRLGDSTPSERTVARILRRAGKVKQRKRRGSLSVVAKAPNIVAEAPNQIWTVDFKGWWRAQNGQRCEPLTVRDDFSRYILACELTQETHDKVKAIFLSLFRKYGVPGAIHVDNGTPFVSVRARGGLSKLSAWWISLGIKLVRSRPSCPQDNGAHERMHVDVKGDVQVRPASTPQLQQRELDRWRQEFNQVRPHQALKNKTPAEVYKVTEKRPVRLMKYNYPSDYVQARVSKSGHISNRGQAYFVSESLGEQIVGLQYVDDTHLRVWFGDVDLGLLDVIPPDTDEKIENWQNRLGRKAARKRRT
jgi:transposase InsO family protein